MSDVRTGYRPHLVLVAMTLANAMVLVDQTAVPLALPDIAHQFDVSEVSVQWVLNASLLPLAGLLVLGGKLGDLLGRRRVFLGGSILFAGASALGGLAPMFPILIVARILQGAGGAVMLPATVAILSGAFARADRGRALGTMGGVAAIAGALGPTLGGVLTSAISWRAVLLINVPLLILTVLCTMRSVPADRVPSSGRRVDLLGAMLLCLTLIGLVFGLAQTQTSGWTGPDVIGPVVLAVVAGTVFVVHERRTDDPLMNMSLLRRHHNYLGATISQAVAGMSEMGLGLILPLLLILNLGMPPALAGVALMATTAPMIVAAPLVGRWYDRAGGRTPMTVGFGFLAVSGVAMAIGAGRNSYLWMLPGLLLYGLGLSIVLTVNDPVSLDTVPEADHGQASGVSATAEQGGGAIGIAVLYAVFHHAYLSQLYRQISQRHLPPLNQTSGIDLRDSLDAAQRTGLRASAFDPKVVEYLRAARSASDFGYSIAFIATTVISLCGLVAAFVLVRRASSGNTDP